MCRKQSLLIISMLAASCTVGPDYVRPGVTLTPQFKEGRGQAFKPELKEGWKLAEPRDLVNRGQWWKIFCDPELNALEDQLNHYNQSIVNALANYEQAKDTVYAARSAYLPIVSAAFNLTRQRQGGGINTFFSTSGGTTSTDIATTGNTGTTTNSRGITRTIYSAFITATWEPDIWGLVRRTVEGEVAAAQSSQALLAATTLSVQGLLAQYYFQLRTLDRDQQLLNDTVGVYRKTLALTRNQYNSGVVSRADIVQAQSQLENAQALAINNRILRSQYEHAIAVLMGRPPATFTMRFKPLKAKPPVIPVTIPSLWLERRPDVAQAERLMHQANAKIGVACAAYFPTLNLSASASAAARSLGKLFTAPALGWSAGLQVAQTIFNGGLRWANLMAAKAGYMAEIANYRQTVLVAFQDVEDNLVALRVLKEQGIVQNAAAASAQKALALVLNQYKSGIVPYSSVLTAQIQAFNAQKAAYDVIGLQMSAAVRLIKALGGGWSVQDIVSV
ncbi:MAG: efflux transporter outer membrane subunit [Tatlockia sp.]|nr:efflux transporter outer membrane subunit [Tatlockia sp.]